MKHLPLLFALFIATSPPTATAARWSLTVVDDHGAPLQADITLETQYSEPLLHLKTDAAGHASGDIQGRVFIYARGHAPAGGDLRAGLNRVTLGAPQSVSGLVEDENGRPLPGVAVTLDYASSGDPFGTLENSVRVAPDKEESLLFMARTDAAGRYTLHDIPADCTVTVAIDDPLWRSRYARFDETLGEIPATISTSPAARVSGRLLKEDGSPLTYTAIEVFGQEDSARGITDVDGRYLVGGLPTGKVMIDVERAGAVDGVLPRLVADIAVGTETKLADARLVPGAIIEIATVPAVAGVYLGLDEKDRLHEIAARQLRTGEGQILVHVRPGKYALTMRYPSGGYHAAADFLRDGLIVETRDGQTTHVTVPLVKALSITGVARDEQGAPVEGATVNYSPWGSFTTGPGGRYELSNQLPGDIEFGEGNEWAVVSPLKVTLPAPGSVDFVLRKIPLGRLRGRVVDDRGNPIEGAAIKVTWPWGAGGERSYTGYHAVRSGADGTYQLARMRAGATLTASRPDCRFVGGGVVTSNTTVIGLDGAQLPNPNPTFTITDIVLQPLPRRAAGRVVDGAGKPVANALVAALCDNSEAPSLMGGEDEDATRTIPTTLARTDAAGRFQLSRLPAGELDFAAGAGNGYAQVRSAAAELGDLVLQPQSAPKPDGTLGRKIVQELLAGDDPDRSHENLPLLLAPYDIRAALDAINGLHLGNNFKNASTLSVIELWLKRDPAAALVQLPAMLPALSQPHSFGDVGATGNMHLLLDVAAVLPQPEQATVPAEPANLAVLRAWVRSGLATAHAGVSTVNLATSTSRAVACELADVAALDERLGSGDAAAEAALAVKIAARADADATADPPVLATLSMFEELARGGEALVLQSLPLVVADKRSNAVEYAAMELAHTDASGALRLLAPNGAGLAWEPDVQFGRVAVSVLRLQRPADANAEAALALAYRMPPDSEVDYGQAVALAVAAGLQPAAARPALLRQAFDLATTCRQDNNWVQVIKMANRTEPLLGEELAERAEGNFFDPNFTWNRYNEPNVPALCFRQTQPGRARVWLEWEWRRQHEAEMLAHIAQEMSGLNTARALEMAAAIPMNGEDDGYENNVPRDTARSVIASYLMAPDDRRADFAPVTGEKFSMFNPWTDLQ